MCREDEKSADSDEDEDCLRANRNYEFRSLGPSISNKKPRLDEPTQTLAELAKQKKPLTSTQVTQARRL